MSSGPADTGSPPLRVAQVVCSERFYGVEALFKDNSGNWFSMSQKAK